MKPILAIALIAALVWGAEEHRRRAYLAEQLSSAEADSDDLAQQLDEANADGTTKAKAAPTLPQRSKP